MKGAKKFSPGAVMAVHKHEGHLHKGEPQTEFAKGGHWIQGAIKHPGAEKRAAAKSGESTHSYMEQHKDSPGLAGQRARLGLTLSKMSKK